MNLIHSNPLLPLHKQQPEVDLQPYDQIEIVSTFGKPQAEYAALRKACGLMDLPQRGILELTGKDRLPFLNNLLSNETWNKNTKTGLQSGQGVYAFFLNLRGRIVADVNVLERGDRTLLEADVRKIEMLRTTFDKYLFTEQVTLANRSADLHEMALHGPTAGEVIRQATGAAPTIEPMQSVEVRLFDVAVTIWRDDVCGVPGYHLIVPTDRAVDLWTALVERFGFATELGKRMLRPVGWAAFNTARIEAGRPLLDIDFPSAAPDRPGAKLNPSEADAATQEQSAGQGILPAETGQAPRAVAYTKCYIGQEVVARMHARKQVARQIVGIRLDGDELPIAGTKVFDGSGNEVGVVTSSTPSPTLSNIAIALALVKRPFFTVGTELQIPAEGAMRTGRVIELPFLRPT